MTWASSRTAASALAAHRGHLGVGEISLAAGDRTEHYVVRTSPVVGVLREISLNRCHQHRMQLIGSLEDRDSGGSQAIASVTSCGRRTASSSAQDAAGA
jgi:hypothetical protein